MNISTDSERRLRELIAKYELCAVEDLLMPQALECWPLWRDAGEDYSQVGNCRYGGIPDLPCGMDWPKTSVGYLNFLMQINLADLPPLWNNPLPSHGMLYFFLEAEGSWATDVTSKVFYCWEDAAELRRTEIPAAELMALDYFLDLKPHKLVSSLGISLPDYRSPTEKLVDALRLVEGPREDDYSAARYCRLLSEGLGRPGEQTAGQLLGNSTAQRDIAGDAWLSNQGLHNKIFDHPYREQHADELRIGASKWQPLWRIDSDFEVGVCIQDAGSYHTLIQRDDLAALDFSNIYTEAEGF